jgi:hypothetical protein
MFTFVLFEKFAARSIKILQSCEDLARFQPKRKKTEPIFAEICSNCMRIREIIAIFANA